MKSLVTAAGLMGVTTPGWAQVPKLAYIDSQKIMAEAPGAKEARQAFEKDMARYKGELDQLETDLKKMVGEYDQQQVMLSPEVKRTREEAIRTKQREFQQRAGQLEDQATKRQAELVQPIMTKISAVINEIRKEEAYSLILDAAAGGLIAADPALDITEKVLTRLKATANKQP
ncbi:MAG: OmpH family outer membrane protein [Gemmatimonadetes bacterium]|nr:OmpH family outer membrane protein [Gemmatimonadota bacterium]